MEFFYLLTGGLFFFSLYFKRGVFFSFSFYFSYYPSLAGVDSRSLKVSDIILAFFLLVSTYHDLAHLLILFIIFYFLFFIFYLFPHMYSTFVLVSCQK